MFNDVLTLISKTRNSALILGNYIPKSSIDNTLVVNHCPKIPELFGDCIIKDGPIFSKSIFSDDNSRLYLFNELLSNRNYVKLDTFLIGAKGEFPAQVEASMHNNNILVTIFDKREERRNTNVSISKVNTDLLSIFDVYTHDLNNILNDLYLPIQCVDMDYPHLDLTSIVANNLAKISKLTSMLGSHIGNTIKPSKVNLYQIVEQAFEDNKFKLLNDKIQTKIFYNENNYASQSIYGNFFEPHLSCVLNELILDATKYMRSDEKYINAIFRTSESFFGVEDGVIYLDIISSTLLPDDMISSRMFCKGVKGEKTGTGMGLSNSLILMHQNKGHMELLPYNGKEVGFRLTIPLYYE